MCITYIENTDCFKLVIRSKQEHVVHRLPVAGDVFAALKSEGQHESMWISDVFLHAYVYKPLLFDLADIHTDEEYKVLKNLKKARYIHSSLLDTENSATALIKHIHSGEIVVRGEYIEPAFLTETQLLKKEMHPEMEDPIVFQVKKHTTFDIYVGCDTESRAKICGKKALQLAGNEYEILSAETVTQEKKAFAVLQADGVADADCRIAKDSRSVFRVRYDAAHHTQYVKAGSVLEKDEMMTTYGGSFQPYVIFWGE